jgi:hypothetical protein
MLGELLRREETSSALVLALSGKIVVLIANGPGPVSLKRVVSGARSNPVPRPEPVGAHGISVSFQAPLSRTVA